MVGLDVTELAVRLVQLGVSEAEPLSGGASSLTYRGVRHGQPVVVKVAPPGLPPVLHRDVLRQARLLRWLAPTDVPVPEVLAEDPSRPPEVPPLFVMSLLPGDSIEPLYDLDGPVSGAPDATTMGARLAAAAAVMASLHRLVRSTGGVAPKSFEGRLQGGPDRVDVDVMFWPSVLQTVSAQVIPSAAEDLTPVWLSEVLGAEVSQVEVVDSHSGTTGRVQLRVVAEPPLPATLFAKIQPFDAKQRDYLRMIGMGVVEARFYAELGQSVPVRIPRVWHSSFDENNGDFVMILEDLEASGCRFPAADDEDAADVAASLMTELGALHAAYADQMPRWLQDRALGASDNDHQTARLGRLAEIVQSALDQFSTEMPDAFRQVGQLFISRGRDIATLWNTGTLTLAHGDNHVRNLFMDGARVGFFDWAVVCAAPGMRDVSYFLTKMPTEVRRECQDALITRYRSAMADRGVVLEERDLYDQYRLFSVYSWVSATTTAAMGSAWHPSSIGFESMQRATTAIVDLQAVALLVEQLG